MNFFDERQQERLRQSERARFERWFVPTPLGRAYIDRVGRPRGVREEEYLAWRSAAFERIEQMLDDLPKQAFWAIGGLLLTVGAGMFLCQALGIDGTARTVAISVATVVVELGLVGIDLFDYMRDWRAQRNVIEAAVVGRAPLPLDPEQAQLPRNWFLIGQYAIAGLFLLMYLGMHIDESWVERVDWRWVILIVPLAWGLHFAAQRHDRAAQDRFRR